MTGLPFACRRCAQLARPTSALPQGRGRKSEICRICAAELAAEGLFWCAPGRHPAPQSDRDGRSSSCRACRRKSTTIHPSSFPGYLPIGEVARRSFVTRQTIVNWLHRADSPWGRLPWFCDLRKHLWVAERLVYPLPPPLKPYARQPPPAVPPPPRPCRMCGAEFVPTPRPGRTYRGGKSTRLCPACYDSVRREQLRQAHVTRKAMRQGDTTDA